MLNDETVARVRLALEALAEPDAVVLPDALAPLAELSRDGHALSIDMAASATLGAPLVVARRQSAPELARLTPRQREVAALIAEGLPNKEIARRLGVTLGTVKDHVHAILTRLGCDTRAALIATLLKA